MDAIKRAARTFLQAAIGVFLALTITPGATGDVPGTDLLKRAIIAAAWAGIIAVLSFVQNALEDGGVIKPILKNDN